MKISPRVCGALLVLWVPAVALGFWGKKTDEERLKEKLQSLKVQLYVTGKAAVTKTAGSDEAKVVRERLLGVVGGAAGTVKAAQAGQEGAPAAGVGMTVKEVAALGKALWDMREVGKEVLSGDKGELPPLLPVVLGPLGVAPELVSRLDAPTDSAVLFVALALVKLHPESPVPIPTELILYEGSRTDPTRVKVPGFAGQLHALKTYTLAMSGMCDLAEKEARALDALGPATDPKQLAEGVKLLTGKEVTLSPAQLVAVNEATQVLAQGSLALCFFSREAWDKGQVALGRFLDVAERSGLDEPELQVLRAYVDCGSKTPEQGRTRLTALSSRPELPESVSEDLKHLQKSCGDNEASTQHKVVDKVRLGRVIVRVAWAHLKRSGLLEALGDQAWVKAVGDFVSAMGQGIGKVPGGLQVSLGGAGWD